MKLKISRREGTFTSHLNGRVEGSGDGAKGAADISVSFYGKKRELDILIPFQEGKASQAFYTQAGALQYIHDRVHYLTRKPEGLKITIHDSPKKPMVFKDEAAKDIVVTLHEKWHIEVTMKLQVHPNDDQAARLFRLIRAKNCEFEIEAEQEELFTDEGEEEGGSDEAQQELPGVDGEEPEGEEGGEEGEEGFDPDEDEDDL